MTRNLDIYNLGTLQNFRSLLTQYQRDGMTNINDILMDINEVMKDRAPKIKKIKTKRSHKIVSCPKCGWRLFPVKNDEGLYILGCSKCRYSAIVNNINLEVSR